MSARRKPSEIDAEPEAFPVPVGRYRAMVFRKPVGPWRTAKAEAQRDAVKRKLASYDEERGIVFLGPAVWIAEG